MLHIPFSLLSIDVFVYRLCALVWGLNYLVGLSQVDYCLMYDKTWLQVWHVHYTWRGPMRHIILILNQASTFGIDLELLWRFIIAHGQLVFLTDAVLQFVLLAYSLPVILFGWYLWNAEHVLWPWPVNWPIISSDSIDIWILIKSGSSFSCFTLILEEDTVQRHSLQPVYELFRVKGVRLSVPHELGEPEPLICEVASGVQTSWELCFWDWKH